MWVRCRWFFLGLRFGFRAIPCSWGFGEGFRYQLRLQEGMGRLRWILWRNTGWWACTFRWWPWMLIGQSSRRRMLPMGRMCRCMCKRRFWWSSVKELWVLQCKYPWPCWQKSLHLPSSKEPGTCYAFLWKCWEQWNTCEEWRFWCSSQSHRKQDWRQC